MLNNLRINNREGSASIDDRCDAKRFGKFQTYCRSFFNLR